MPEPVAICTIVLIALTTISSFVGFRDPGYREQFIFSPLEILASRQYHRLVTSAFLHADWTHLLMNMVSLYLFGRHIELYYGPGQFLLIYFSAIIGGDLLSLWLHRHHDYRSYGASGGVCGIMFSHIFLFPGSGISMYFLPIYVPAWLYAILFLVGSFVALKKQDDGIGHDAHIGGAIIGMMTTVALHPRIVPENLALFLTVTIVSLLLFIYLVKNPMLLPMSAFLPDWPRRKSRSDSMPVYKREALTVDEVLEKISKSGMESLSAEEKKLLHNVSSKYQRRADSKKPGSDLII